MENAAEMLAALLDEEKLVDFEWLQRMTRNIAQANVLWGFCTAVGVEHQDWTFWEVLHEVRRTFKAIV